MVNNTHRLKVRVPARILAWHATVIDGIGAVAAMGFCAIAVLIIADVTVRYFAIGAIPWAVEVSEYLMLGATFIGAPWVMRKNGHVRMDALLMGLPERRRRVADLVINMLCLGASGVLLVYGARACINAWDEGLMAYKSLTYPEWLILLPIPVCGFFLSLEFAARILNPELNAHDGLQAGV